MDPSNFRNLWSLDIPVVHFDTSGAFLTSFKNSFFNIINTEQPDSSGPFLVYEKKSWTPASGITYSWWNDCLDDAATNLYSPWYVAYMYQG